MSKQVVTKEKVSEARAKLIGRGIAPSLDRIVELTGGSKSTVSRYNKDIEEELTQSLKLGADLPPEFIAGVIDFGRQTLSHALIVAEQRHEEERHQFRLSLRAHLAERELLEAAQVESQRNLEAILLDASDDAEKIASVQLELDQSILRVVELDAELKNARSENHALRDDLRRLEEYRRVAILLARVAATPNDGEPDVSPEAPTATLTRYGPEGEQLDLDGTGPDGFI